jgi:hypothetical protein
MDYFTMVTIAVVAAFVCLTILGIVYYWYLYKMAKLKKETPPPP